ncbi:MAG: GAF and ANTAR domain-containing protein [Actinomycetota bacterium]|nr:GAF and ANTAR domain-containing protein [Actinomycetota bacterium]
MTGGSDAQYPRELIEGIEALSKLVLADEDVSTTSQRIAGLAVHAIDGADHCSVSLVRKREIETVAATAEVGNRIDEVQYEIGEGPCLSSIEKHETFRIPDMERDETWPRFSKRAAEETGVRSMLAYVLEVHEDALGALNLTSTKTNAFDDDDVATGTVFAAQAGVALANALTHAQEKAQVAQLEEGLQTRKMIGQATGLLMAHEGLTSEEAFTKLVKVSQTANVKLREIARRYVDTWEDKAKRAVREAP